jgi:hypothetical protein
MKQEDVVMGDATVPAAPEPPSYFTVYASANEIVYVPENALKEGLGMVKAIKTSLKKLEMGSKLRQEVWAREIERYVTSNTICNPTNLYEAFKIKVLLRH